MSNITPGTYRGWPVRAALGLAGTGTEQIAVQFEFVDPPGERLTWRTATAQPPAPSPASESATRSAAARPRRSRPNERLVGLANTRGRSARGSQIMPPPSRVGGVSFRTRVLPFTGPPVSTSADLTWATVHVGCRSSSRAAAPAV